MNPSPFDTRKMAEITDKPLANDQAGAPRNNSVPMLREALSKKISPQLFSPTHFDTLV
jgi:hypothetical protein